MWLIALKPGWRKKRETSWRERCGWELTLHSTKGWLGAVRTAWRWGSAIQVQSIGLPTGYCWKGMFSRSRTSLLVLLGAPGGYRACQSTQAMLREEMWSSGHNTQHLARSLESQVLEMASPQEAGWSDQGLGAPYTPESVSVKWGQWWSPRFYYSNSARFKLGSFRTVFL